MSRIFASQQRKDIPDRGNSVFKLRATVVSYIVYIYTCINIYIFIYTHNVRERSLKISEE